MKRPLLVAAVLAAAPLFATSAAKANPIEMFNIVAPTAGVMSFSGTGTANFNQNLGTNNSNVTPQSKLLITRNGRLLGRLTPNSVEANQTVCDLNARDINRGVRIQPGDQVTLAESSTGQ